MDYFSIDWYVCQIASRFHQFKMPEQPLMPARSIVYSRDELLALRDYDVTLARSVRKSIFNCRLWLPGYLRTRQALPLEKLNNKFDDVRICRRARKAIFGLELWCPRSVRVRRADLIDGSALPSLSVHSSHQQPSSQLTHLHQLLALRCPPLLSA